MRRRRLLWISAVIMLLTIFSTLTSYWLPGMEAEENVVMAVEFNDHSAAFWVALDKGFFKQEGVNITFLKVFKTGLELAAALTRGDVQVGWACLGPTIMTYSRGVPIKIVAGTHLHGYAILSRPEIRRVPQLNGKVVGCPGKGSPCYLLLKMVIEKYNLSDVQVKKMPPYMMLNALLAGQIDAAAMPEHYATLAELKGFNVLVRSQDIWPSMPGSILFIREDLLERNPELVLKLVKITKRATEYINSHFNESAEIVSRHLGITFDQAYRSMLNLDYSTQIDLDQIQRYVDLMIRYGALQKRIDPRDLIDLRFLEEVEQDESVK